MITFDLACRLGGHRFEGWFGSSDDYAAQQARGLVACPQCGSCDVIKAPMAPNIGRKGNQAPSAPAAMEATPQAAAPLPSVPAPQPMSKGALPPEAAAMMRGLAELQARALAKSRWVGDGFAEVTREMHYGEREIEPIHGTTTLKEAQELIEEGIDVAPLPFPIAPPGEAN